MLRLACLEGSGRTSSYTRADLMIRATYIAGHSPPRELVSQIQTFAEAAQHEAHRTILAVRCRAAARLRRARTRFMALKRRRSELRQDAAKSQQELTLHARYHEILRQANRECLELALRISREFISAEFESRPELLAAMLERELGVLLERRTLQLRVNPADIRSVRERLVSLSFTLSADETIPRGTALASTASGNITIDWLHHYQYLSEDLLRQLDAALKETTHAAACAS